MPCSPRPEDRGAERVGGRREQRAEREQQQAADQHRHPAAQVGQPAQQRQGGGVAEQEAADDRRRPLELVEPDADPGEDVGQRQDDDVGVGRRDEDGEGREDDDRQPRPVAGAGRRPPAQPVGGAVISTSAPKSLSSRVNVASSLGGEERPGQLRPAQFPALGGDGEPRLHRRGSGPALVRICSTRSPGSSAVTSRTTSPSTRLSSPSSADSASREQLGDAGLGVEQRARVAEAELRPGRPR